MGSGGAGNSKALVYGVTVVPITLCLGVAGFILILLRGQTQSFRTGSTAPESPSY